ncbi:MAG: pyrroline-5-carboxylate reductase [Defluviitaleaceae bacterium]|nr:pyrroline-5-carboxylate reductase [Defluviitaleaceae bacterium]
MITNSKLGIIGVGNMGGAILQGVLAGGMPASQISIFDTNEDMLSRQAQAYGVHSAPSAAELAKHCDIVIIAVKPYGVASLLRDLASSAADTRTIYVSVAAGVTIADMEGALGSGAIAVRTMPNTPAAVGEAMTAVCAGANVSAQDLELVREVLGLFGKTVVLGEHLLEAATGISGCAPAYVYLFIEALADAGVMHGLSRADAYTFAAQAVLGAGKMVLESGRHPGALKDAVCSPGGPTITAIAALERSGFRGAVINAVDAAVDKAVRMKG